MTHRHDKEHRWGVILAGGDGVRLRPLTRLVAGDDRPKQFTPLLEGRTLLAQTRLRTALTVEAGRTLFVLTRKHEAFYAAELAAVPRHRMVVQPSNRGTLPAILWSLLRIHQRDPDALVAFFPSDHYYAAETKFQAAVATAFEHTQGDAETVVLFGAEADHPETGYGWIEPDGLIRNSSQWMPVKRFWEKPSSQIAETLLERGCLWNTFVMVGSAGAFLNMIRAAAPALYDALRPVLSLSNLAIEAEFMRHVYHQLAPADFSKQVLSVSTQKLAVANIGDIGWSDLGDPQRLITTLFESGIQNPWVASGACNQCGRVLRAGERRHPAGLAAATAESCAIRKGELSGY